MQIYSCKVLCEVFCTPAFGTVFLNFLTMIFMSERELQNPRSGRCQYLITYLQADEQRFPTRESFGNMLENEFNTRNSQIKMLVQYKALRHI